MDEAYAVFDTLSVGADFNVTPDPGPKKEPPASTSEVAPVIARVGHVSTAAEAAPAVPPAAPAPVEPAPAKRSRIDARGTDTHPHTWAVRDAAEPTTVAATSTIEGVNLRIDTPESSAASIATDPATVESTSLEDETFAETLLQLDAIIAPYARWIALAAVIAAIGLTLVLLRGEPQAPVSDAPGATVNQASSTDEISVFAELDPLDPITPSTPASASAPPVTRSQGPLVAATANTAATPATAAGPVSAPFAAGPSAPQTQVARLAGEVLPSTSTPPTQVPAIASRPQADGYPRTAGYPNTNAGTRR